MFHKTQWSLRWAAAGAVGLSLAIWFAAVSFALLGFQRMAEGIAALLEAVLPITFALVVAEAVVAAIRWLDHHNMSR